MQETERGFSSKTQEQATLRVPAKGRFKRQDGALRADRERVDDRDLPLLRAVREVVVAAGHVLVDAGLELEHAQVDGGGGRVELLAVLPLLIAADRASLEAVRLLHLQTTRRRQMKTSTSMPCSTREHPTHGPRTPTRALARTCTNAYVPASCVATRSGVLANGYDVPCCVVKYRMALSELERKSRLPLLALPPCPNSDCISHALPPRSRTSSLRLDVKLSRAVYAASPHSQAPKRKRVRRRRPRKPHGASAHLPRSEPRRAHQRKLTYELLLVSRPVEVPGKVLRMWVPLSLSAITTRSQACSSCLTSRRQIELAARASGAQSTRGTRNAAALAAAPRFSRLQPRTSVAHTPMDAESLLPKARIANGRHGLYRGGELALHRRTATEPSSAHLIGLLAAPPPSSPPTLAKPSTVALPSAPRLSRGRCSRLHIEHARLGRRERHVEAKIRNLHNVVAILAVGALAVVVAVVIRVVVAGPLEVYPVILAHHQINRVEIICSCRSTWRLAFRSNMPRSARCTHCSEECTAAMADLFTCLRACKALNLSDVTRCPPA
eukprot:5199096-Pleurochrysis_carterae.AAC.2